MSPLQPSQGANISQDYQVTDPLEVGQRLDRWLATQMTDLSRSQIQKLIEQGQVCVNQQSCTAKKYEIQPGDRVTVAVPPPTSLNLEPERIPLDILYEDEHLLIVNKPAGLVVHPAPGHATGTLVHALLAHCQSEDGLETSLSGIGGVQRPGIVHRLDKDTSGALVIAKTDRAHQHLQSQIQAKTAQREYLGIVYGKPRSETGSIDKPIGRQMGDRKKMAIVPEEKGGRAAITHWEIKQRLGNFTLMYFRLETGRTHQIRVHCADMGFPIVGDPLYSRGKEIGVNLTGQVLHAWRLKVQHPITDEWIQVEAPLPQEFLKVLRSLEQRTV
ncbi:MAG: RluA family pseudouridine synthase [Acaryochloridaceae cyanobacterium RU_4_10]|jgi:23S rRNA pseudouridine1911/1915/1917 synthase|nr:RluA family pseudouridine synthase [Acaryochloridaceae cyanobacterium RU_4_10]